jgi:hypothetical protein
MAEEDRGYILKNKQITRMKSQQFNQNHGKKEENNGKGRFKRNWMDEKH